MAEILVATVGFLVLSLALISVNVTTFKTLSVVSAKSLLTTTLQAATEQLGRDINRAQGTVAACGAYNSELGSAAVAGRLLLDAPGVGPGAANRIIYQCESGGCIASSPGVLVRIIARTSDVPACSVAVERRVVTSDSDVIRFEYAVPPTAGTDVRVRLGVRIKIGQFIVPSTLVVGYNFRN